MDREHEKRLFPRRTTIPVPVFVRWSAHADEELSGEVLDYAPSGLTVQLGRAVPVGSRLTVRPQREADETDDVLLVSSWFRRHPEELKRVLPLPSIAISSHWQNQRDLLPGESGST